MSGTTTRPDPGLEDLVGKYRRSLFALALSRLGRVEDAEDAVQSALLGFLARGGAAGISDPAAYLRTAVLNRCRNRVGRARPGVSLPDEPLSPAEPPGSAAARRELSGLVRDAIRGLPQAYRAVVWLVHVEGLTPGEVAAATAANVHTVKSALARGRKLLRERLGPVLRKGGYLAV